MISLCKNLLIVFFKKRPTLGLYSKAFMNYNNLTLDSALSSFSKRGGVTVKGLNIPIDQISDVIWFVCFLFLLFACILERKLVIIVFVPKLFSAVPLRHSCNNQSLCMRADRDVFPKSIPDRGGS